MLKTIARTLVGATLLMPVTALAAPEIQLPRTGQTGCWNTNGTPIPCDGTGQDGDTLTGVAVPTPRFTDNGNGTLTDSLTDLVWIKNADCYNAITWQQALDRAGTLASGACGLDDSSVAGDWRVPNRNEMLSIINYQESDRTTWAWLTEQGFTNAVHGWYWTSNSYTPRDDPRPAAKWVIHEAGDALPSDDPLAAGPVHALFVRNLSGPSASVSPATDEFGDVVLNTASTPRTYAIANGGAQNLVVSGIALAGTDSAMFALSSGDGTGGTCGSLTPTVAPGANCTVSVVFTPTTIGAKTASLQVASNSIGNATAESALTGTGVTVSYEVTASVSGENGTVSPTAPVSVEDGATTSFTLSPAEGHDPSASVEGTCPAGSFSGNTYTTGAITADCSVIFSFVPRTFTISTATNGNGDIACTPATTVAMNTEASCTAMAASGAQITSVTIDGTAQTVADPAAFTYSFGPVTADHSISANFTVIELTVTFASGENGAITGNTSQSVAYNGSTAEVTASPADGFHFVNWTGTGGFASTENPLVISNVTANQTITANFEPNPLPPPTEAEHLADIVKAFKSSLGKSSLTEQEKVRVDVAPLGEDGKPVPDGVVDVADVVILLRRLIGLVSW